MKNNGHGGVCVFKGKHRLGAALLLVSIVLSGCMVSGGVTKPVIQNIEAPIIPDSLIDDSAQALIANYDASEWGGFAVIPQIAINYNQYMENTINGLLTRMVAITAHDKEMGVNGVLSSIKYEKIAHDKYDTRITFTDISNGAIEAVFYRNDLGTLLDLVIRFRGDEDEFREIIYEDLGEEKHVVALSYRRDAHMGDGRLSDMNDIVEIWETADVIQTKCLRVYNLSEDGNRILTDFAAISYKEPLSPTTAVLYRNSRENRDEVKEIEESPAIFNDVDKYIGSLEERKSAEGYPTVEEADDVWEKGITHTVVQEARIDLKTLESNLFELVFGF